MSKCFWNFKTLNWFIPVTTECKYLLDTIIVGFNNFYRQFPVVDRANTPLDEFTLKGCLVLLDCLMRQLDSLVVSAIDLIPHEALYIFALAFDSFENLVHSFRGGDSLLG